MKNTPWLALALVTLAAPALADGPPPRPIRPLRSMAPKSSNCVTTRTTCAVCPTTRPKLRPRAKKIADALYGAVGIQTSGRQVGSRRKSRRTRSCHLKTTPSSSAPAQSSTYGAVSAQDVKVWNTETYKEAVYGSSVFHSG